MKILLEKKNEFIQIFETIFLITRTSFVVKYRNSFIGYFWSILTPLIFATTYFSIFSIFLKIDIENYAVFLLTGFYPWLFFQNSVLSSARSLISNPILIKKIRVRKFIFPLSSILIEVFNFILTLPIIILFLYISKLDLFFSWLWQIPFLIILQIILIYPLAIFFSILCVFLRDIEHLLANLLQIMFFLTPILYKREMIPDYLIFFYNLNPVVYIIENWRNVFFYGNVNFFYASLILLIGIILILFSRVYYRTFKDKIPELI